MNVKSGLDNALSLDVGAEIKPATVHETLNKNMSSCSNEGSKPAFRPAGLALHPK